MKKLIYCFHFVKEINGNLHTKMTETPRTSCPSLCRRHSSIWILFTIVS